MAGKLFVPAIFSLAPFATVTVPPDEARFAVKVDRSRVAAETLRLPATGVLAVRVFVPPPLMVRLL